MQRNEVAVSAKASDWKMYLSSVAINVFLMEASLQFLCMAE